MSEYIKKIRLPLSDGEKRELHVVTPDEVEAVREQVNAVKSNITMIAANAVQCLQPSNCTTTTFATNNLLLFHNSKSIVAGYKGATRLFPIDNNLKMSGTYTGDEIYFNREDGTQRITTASDGEFTVNLNGSAENIPIQYSGLFNGIKNLTSLTAQLDPLWGYSLEKMFYNSKALQTAVVKIELDGTETPVSAASMFYGCSVMTSVDLNLPPLSDCRYMFSGCIYLTKLDISGLDTSSATNFSGMFSYSNKLATLNLSGVDTSKVTNFSGMFNGCSSLRSLDLSGFDTSKVTDFSYMFYNCSSLTSLDLSGFKTSSATRFSNMFNNCCFLTSLDLSEFDTSKVTDFSYMFFDCSRLTSLNLSGLDTSSATTLIHMFYNCVNLTDVIGPITRITQSLSLSDSPLTNESAMVFINGLDTVTDVKTLTLSSKTYSTLTSEQKALATAKGWTIAKA